MNRGLSGYNTSHALKALPQIFQAPTGGGPQIKYLVSWHTESFLQNHTHINPQLILLGANDACIPLPTTTQHVPLDQYKANLTKIITHPTILAHKPQILLVTPPPIDEMQINKLDMAKGHSEGTRKSKISASYSQAVRDIVAQHPETILVDLHKALMDHAVQKTAGFEPKEGVTLGDSSSGLRGHLEFLLPDGLHMSGEAYRVFYETVLPHIPQWEGKEEEERVGYVLPDWTVAPSLED